MPTAKADLQSVIRTIYASMPESANDILTTATTRQTFLAEVLQQYPQSREDEILRELIKMRKRGERNGGLPRKPR